MSFARPIAEEDLHGFLDGELDDDKRETIAAHLARTPADAARIENWHQQSLLLRAAFAQVPLEPVPMSLSFSFAPRLVTSPSFAAGLGVRDAPPRHTQQRSFAFSVAAFIAGVSITLAASFSLHRYAEHTRLLQAAQGPALARLAASALRHSPLPAARAQAVPSMPGTVEPVLVALPMLQQEGWRLLRGEIRGRAGSSANCLDFAGPNGAPAVLCIAAIETTHEKPFGAFDSASPYSVYWRDGASLYALATRLEKAQLVARAQDIRAALAAKPSP